MAWRAKDALVIVVDVGRAMQEPVASSEKRQVTKADVALRMARNLVQQKVLFNPKHEVGLVLFGTQETSNALQADGYEHVHVARGGKVEAADLETLRMFSAPPAGGEEPDAVNALIVALDLMINHTKEQKYQKTIRLLTDSHSAAPGDEDLLECAKKLEVTNTKLLITLVGAEDPGVWPVLARANPQVEIVSLETLARACSLCVKPVEQRAKVRLQLVISPDLEINVGIYTRTTRVAFPTLKKRSKLAAAMPTEHMKKDGVVVERTYHLADDPDGEEVKKEDRIKGHKYGSSIVPMSEYDEAALMYTCERTLTALGFAPADSVGPEHSTRQTETVAADKGDPKAYCALESLVEAMVAEGRVMIARYSFRKNSPPRMVALVPHRSGREDRGSHLEIQYLPFTEDIREWTCASLPMPSAAQRDAAAALVDALDLEPEIAGAEPAAEPLLPEGNHNPALTRFYSFLTKRALDPAAKVPPAGSETCAIEKPPSVAERLRVSGLAERMGAVFGLQKVEKAGKGKRAKRFWREAILEKSRQCSLGEVDTKRIKVDTSVKKAEKDEDEDKVKSEGSQGAALPVGMAAPVEPPPRVHIGSVHPERDFERWLALRAGGVDTVGPAIEQMRNIIDRLAEEGEEFHGKALSCLTTLRRGCVKEGEAASFNDFVRRLRLGETKRRARFWERARESAIGLITDTEVATSTVTSEEAKAFLRGEVYVSPLSAGSSAPAAAAPAALSERDLEAMIE